MVKKMKMTSHLAKRKRDEDEPCEEDLGKDAMFYLPCKIGNIAQNKLVSLLGTHIFSLVEQMRKPRPGLSYIPSKCLKIICTICIVLVKYSLITSERR